MLPQFRSYIETHNLVPPSAHVLAALSAGVDSVVMAHLLHRTGQLHGIAHCHFGLRAADADADQAFTEALAAELNVPFFTIRFDTKAEARAGESTQMAARRLRFDWFEQLMDENAFTAVAIASHLDDQAETMLTNVLRGTGPAGLHGILPARNRVIHPMLIATKAEIIDYAKAEGIPWREDASNREKDYLRNRLRLDVLPLLNELKPGLSAVMNDTASHMRDMEAVAQLALKQWLQVHAQHDGDRLLLNVEALQHKAELPAMLYHWLSSYGFNRTQTNAVPTLLESQSGRQLESASHLLLRNRNHLILAPKTQTNTTASEANSLEINIHSANQSLQAPIPLSCQLQPKAQAPTSTQPTVATLGADTLEFLLTLRPWRPGDSFQPLGMSGTKKLSDFLIDQKVATLDKPNTYVLCSGTQIAWVVGHRIAHPFRITETTQNVFVAQLQLNT